ncbi:Zn(II)2Cys6 transcription factor domain-containing protein [Aspergillus stella-maris]|uniref:Zn(II)2Cys6 transcription factor domain-containing protein n=1 Tax=Aspergillus stella-maris TaxID=1810926 RepID=UPI003CCE0694
MEGIVEASEKRIECPNCAITFSHRSSLVRHLRKKCNQPQSASVRRKACTQCVTDKTRCNLKRPSCSRCALRQAPCHYPYPTPDSEAPSPDAELSLITPFTPSAPSGQAAPLLLSELQQPTDSSGLFDTLFPDPPPWDLSWLDESNILPSSRRNSALVLNGSGQAYHADMSGDLSASLLSPKPSQDNAAALYNHSMEFIFRVLRAWPRMLAEEFQTPPLIHHSQIKDDKSLPLPLANCFTLVKMWHGHCQGAEEMVQRLIIDEINSLLTKFEELDEPTLLAVLQAVTIYIIILLFPSGRPRPMIPDYNLFRKIQDLVNFTAATGLFLQEERERVRPTWEAWVHVTSKRRSVLALYLIHWAYAVFHNIPPFNCRELGFMPGPAAKILWQAQSEQEWSSLYIKWLARWDGHGYLQGEFDQIQGGILMPPRAEKWLEETDEFGMIMMSIVNATDYHGPAFMPLVH